MEWNNTLIDGVLVSTAKLGDITYRAMFVYQTGHLSFDASRPGLCSPPAAEIVRVLQNYLSTNLYYRTSGNTALKREGLTDTFPTLF